jgi:hypothetical protein
VTAPLPLDPSPCGACLADEHAECERPVRYYQTVRQSWVHPAEYVVVECCCGGGEP